VVGCTGDDELWRERRVCSAELGLRSGMQVSSVRDGRYCGLLPSTAKVFSKSATWSFITVR
jgi:hypothetical protein